MVNKFLIDILDEEEFFEKLSQILDERVKKILRALKEDQEVLMTTAQCMEFLQISRTTLHNRIIDGTIPFLRIGNSKLFEKKKVLEALRKKTKLFDYEDKNE